MMLTLLAILAVAYIVLKVLNTRARFEKADAERRRMEEKAGEAEEEQAEFDEIREKAVDVEDEGEHE